MTITRVNPSESDPVLLMVLDNIGISVLYVSTCIESMLLRPKILRTTSSFSELNSLEEFILNSKLRSLILEKNYVNLTL